MLGNARVVTQPDRVARSTADLPAIEADLSQSGIRLLILTIGGERLDGNSTRPVLIHRPQ
jgi:hypothetical protein